MAEKSSIADDLKAEKELQSARNLSRFSKQEINKLLKSARRVLKHPGFDILIAPALSKHGRILVITPRKVGNAIKRNRFRRRLKEIFRKEKFFETGYDWVIIAQQEGVSLSYDELTVILLDAKQYVENFSKP